MIWPFKKPAKVEIVFERHYGLGTWKVTVPKDKSITISGDLNKGEVVVHFKGGDTVAGTNSRGA